MFGIQCIKIIASIRLCNVYKILLSQLTNWNRLYLNGHYHKTWRKNGFKTSNNYFLLKKTDCLSVLLFWLNELSTKVFYIKRTETFICTNRPNKGECWQINHCYCNFLFVCLFCRPKNVSCCLKVYYNK